MRISAVLLALILGAGPAFAADCRRLEVEGQGYAVCTAQPGADLRLFLTAPDDRPYAGFDRLRAALDAQGKRLAFAMNAGMYHRDRRPVGLFIAEGVERARLVTSAGPGNFGMLPNGVFCILKSGFRVIESRAYKARPPACRHATQSGPMLVIGGALHPRFRAGSDSRYIRNGVGVAADGTAYFAISERPVTFHQFARLFRDRLKTPDALYLDGNVSRLYAPELGRDDAGFAMGPMLGLVRDSG
jgi:uncharacterized protein YigE (DUF2233 family)